MPARPCHSSQFHPVDICMMNTAAVLWVREGWKGAQELQAEDLAANERALA